MKKVSALVSIWLLVLMTISGTAAAQYSSNNYKSNEVFFGAGGETQLNSTHYQASGSVGGQDNGKSTSTHYQAYSGFLTPTDPFLEFGIDSSTVNLGTLDSSSTKTGTAAFHVRAYLNGTYTVQTISQPPKTTSGASHTLTGMSSQASSSIGTEQFGINLKANTSPATFGADPAPQPDSGFAAGIAASGYDTANQFKYVAGNTIAQSNGSGWGETDFTISYIANISPTTPAGSYTMTQDLVVVATY